MLRFSTRDAGCYALTVQAAKGGLKHYRIQHTPGGRYAIGKVECSSLDSLIKRYHAELNLKKPCPGSKYEAMFHAFEKNVASLGTILTNKFVQKKNCWLTYPLSSLAGYQDVDI